jgi:hypothetical protein
LSLFEWRGQVLLPVYEKEAHMGTAFHPCFPEETVELDKWGLGTYIHIHPVLRQNGASDLEDEDLLSGNRSRLSPSFVFLFEASLQVPPDGRFGEELTTEVTGTFRTFGFTRSSRNDHVSLLSLIEKEHNRFQDEQARGRYGLVAHISMSRYRARAGALARNTDASATSRPLSPTPFPRTGASPKRMRDGESVVTRML